MIQIDADAHGCFAAQRWTLDSSTGYAVCKFKGRKYQLHRLITRAASFELVDHHNRNRLDNRRCNLRIATRRVNRINSAGSDRTSPYKGVHLRNGRWRASIKPAGKTLNLGDFDTPEEAARAYDEAALQHFGVDAWTNFRGAIG